MNIKEIREFDIALGLTKPKMSRGHVMKAEELKPFMHLKAYNSFVEVMKVEIKENNVLVYCGSLYGIFESAKPRVFKKGELVFAKERLK